MSKISLFSASYLLSKFYTLVIPTLCIIITTVCADYSEEERPCSDYEMLIINTDQCVSRCPIRCNNGVCFEDGICPCEGHYRTSFEKGLICDLDCLPGCTSAGGYCATSNLCICPHGFIFDAAARRCRLSHGFVLFERCRGRCRYGQCTEKGECICAKGYRRSRRFFGQICTATCKQDCGSHGRCHLPNMCACKKKHYHYQSDGKCYKY